MYKYYACIVGLAAKRMQNINDSKSIDLGYSDAKEINLILREILANFSFSLVHVQWICKFCFMDCLRAVCGCG